MSKYQGECQAGRPKGGEERPGRHVGLGRNSKRVVGDVSGRQVKQGRGTAASGEAVRQGRWSALQAAASNFSCILRSMNYTSHIRPGHCCSMRRPPLPSHPPPLRPPRLPPPSLPSRRCLGASPAVHPSRAWASLGAASFELSLAWLIYACQEACI